MTAELPAHRTDDDTFDVVDDALSALALRVSVSDDVLYSLRYRDDTHIAVEQLAIAVCDD